MKLKIFVALVIFLSSCAFAESWIHPDKITFHSKNKNFELTIYAANRNVYYFTYFDSALYLKEAELNKNYCYGELKENKGNVSRLMWQKTWHVITLLMH